MPGLHRIGMALLGVGLLVAAPARAQGLPSLPTNLPLTKPAPSPEPAPSSEPAPSTEPQPAPAPKGVPLPSDFEHVDQVLRQARSDLETPPAVAKLQETIDRDLAEVPRQQRATQRHIESPGSSGDLRDARTAWARTLDQATKAQDTVRMWISTLESDLSSVEALHEEWTQRRAALPANTPKEVRSQIADLVKQLSDLKTRLSSKRAEALSLDLQLTSERETARDMEQQIEQSLRKRLLSRDSPPLWRSFGQGLQLGALREHLVAAVQGRWQAVGGYVDTDAQRLWMHLFLTLLLAWAAVRAGRLPREQRPPGEAVAASTVFARPLSSSLVVSLAAGFTLHAKAPTAVWSLLVLALAVPVARILSRVATREASRAAEVLIGLYLLGRVGALAASDALPFRLFLLVLTLAGGAVAVWALRATRPDKMPVGEAPSSAVRTLFRVGIALMALALLADVGGMVSLSALLLDATLESMLLGIVFWLTETVLEGALLITLHLPIVRNLAVVQRHGDRIAHRGRAWLRFGAVVAWIAASLFVFSLLDPVVGALHAILTTSAHVGNLNLSLGSLIAFGLVGALALWLSRTLLLVLDADVLPRFDLPPGVPGTISKTAQYVVLTLGFFVALSAAGVELTQFAFLAGALGVGVGFGLQTIVNNFVSGLILLFERPLKEGDVIEVGALLGTIQHIGIRACRVRTLEGAEVIVPNASLVSNNVVNWTLSDPLRRIELPVGVAYGTDPKQVLELLTAGCAEHPKVLEQPAPDVLFQGFGDSSLDFKVRAWCNFEDFFQIRSELAVLVHAKIKEAGIEIPFPQRDLHLRSVDAPVFEQIRGKGSDGD